MSFESDCLVFLAVILLLCGDVEHNPGPKIHYPCSICCLSVHWNQKALLCDLCNFWCHCKCSGITNETYSHYQQTSHFTWNCPHCIAGYLPFHDCSFLTSEDSLVTRVDDDCVSNFVQIHYGLYIAHLNCRRFLSHKDEIRSSIDMYLAS